MMEKLNTYYLWPDLFNFHKKFEPNFFGKMNQTKLALTFISTHQPSLKGKFSPQPYQFQLQSICQYKNVLKIVLNEK